MDIGRALSLLTRLPLPKAWMIGDDKRSPAEAAWAYPIVGALVGGVGALTITFVLAIGLPSAVAALCAVGAMIIITGALHEDGLADCADGFWGGWDKERRLAIMKDSQIGTYGVLSLVLCIGLRVSLIATLIEHEGYAVAMIATAMMSRAAMVGIMHALPHARQTGLSATTGRPARSVTGAALLIFFTVHLLVGPAPVIVSLGTVALTLLCLGALARAKVSGQTGDVLGATQQVVEVVLLSLYVTSMSS
ncbi:MAG: adenosylcobinamide-GDP ribazoletransferase [Pseudomonadota bacterium]